MQLSSGLCWNLRTLEPARVDATLWFICFRSEILLNLKWSFYRGGSISVGFSIERPGVGVFLYMRNSRNRRERLQRVISRGESTQEISRGIHVPPHLYLPCTPVYLLRESLFLPLGLTVCTRVPPRPQLFRRLLHLSILKLVP